MIIILGVSVFFFQIFSMQTYVAHSVDFKNILHCKSDIRHNDFVRIYVLSVSRISDIYALEYFCHAILQKKHYSRYSQEDSCPLCFKVHFSLSRISIYLLLLSVRSVPVASVNHFTTVVIS